MGLSDIAIEVIFFIIACKIFINFQHVAKIYEWTGRICGSDIHCFNKHSKLSINLNPKQFQV